MHVHLINPSHFVVRRRRHHAALAVRAGRRDPARRTATRCITDETLEALDPETIQAGRRRRHRHPHRQRAARLRSRARSPASAGRLGRVRRHPRHAVSRGGARARRRARGRQGRRRRGVGDGRSTTAPQRHAAAGVRGRAGSTPTQFVPARWELLPPDRYMWALGADGPRLPEALLVLLGVAHRRPEAAAAHVRTRSSRRSSSCAGGASASSRSPTTTSIR